MKNLKINFEYYIYIFNHLSIFPHQRVAFKTVDTFITMPRLFSCRQKAHSTHHHLSLQNENQKSTSQKS